MSDPSFPASRRATAIDSAVQREIDILDAMRSEELQNEFLRRHEHELYSGPAPFFALTGRAAVEAASRAAATLSKVRDELIEKAANPQQRRTLADDLDAHLRVAHDDISRHAARQSLDWQRSIAQDRLDLLTQKVGRDLTDRARLEAYADAAQSAGRIFARAAGHAIDSPEADAQSTATRSALFRAALEAAFKRDPQRTRASLNDVMRNWMSPEDAAQLDAWTRDQAQETRPDNIEASNSAPPPEINDTAPGPRAPARGIAPNVEPPPESPEYQSAQGNPATTEQAPSPAAEAAIAPTVELPPNDSPKGVAATQQATTAAPSILGTGVTGGAVEQAVASAGQALKGAIPELKAMVPGVLRTLARGGPAIGIMTTPTNSQAETRPIGEDARLAIPPGQAGVLQIRTESGLFGTHGPEIWSDAPVAISRSTDPDGKVVRTVDPVELANAVGPERAARIAASSVLIPAIEPVDGRPTAIEMRIGEKVAGESLVRKREASEEEVTRYCPNLPEYQKTGAAVWQRVSKEGLVGARAGSRVHYDMDHLIKDELGKQLERQGIYKVESEFALHNGVTKSYSRGYSRLDVLEVNRETGTVCIYDFKTGSGMFRDTTMDRYAREASVYLETYFHWGKATQQALARNYTRIYLIPVHLP